MWARFNTIEEFEIWHEQIKQQLGIPLFDGISTEYTQAFEVADGSFSAWVELEHTEGLQEGLPVIKERVWQ